MDRRTFAAFLASAPQQVAIFAPVIGEFARRGFVSRLLSLDSWYGQGVERAAIEAGIGAEVIPRPGGQLDGGFYARPFFAVWRDVIAGRRSIADALVGARVLITGNDSGLLEKAAIEAARRRGIRVVLIQDGKVGDRIAPTGLKARSVRTGRSLLSPVLRRIGLPYLASSQYGEGGADLIAATGLTSAATIRARTRTGQVVVTGQPKYDALLGLRRGGDPSGPVVMFTTPFEADRLGTVYQLAQESFAFEVHRRLSAARIPFVLKPHPREDERGYRSRLGTHVISNSPPRELLLHARAAIVGMSTVTDEAVLLGCPVLVPGGIVHGSRFDHVLPAAPAFEHFESADSVVAAVESLGDLEIRAGIARRQRKQLALEIEAEGMAAPAVVDAVLNLVSQENVR